MIADKVVWEVADGFTKDVWKWWLAVMAVVVITTNLYVSLAVCTVMSIALGLAVGMKLRRIEESPWRAGASDTARIQARTIMHLGCLLIGVAALIRFVTTSAAEKPSFFVIIAFLVAYIGACSFALLRRPNR